MDAGRDLHNLTAEVADLVPDCEDASQHQKREGDVGAGHPGQDSEPRVGRGQAAVAFPTSAAALLALVDVAPASIRASRREPS